MKGINTLIKLNKRTLDELRRQMVALENQKAQLRQLIVTLHEELAREMKLASEQAQMTAFFGDFSRRIRDRQEKILLEIMQLDKKMEMLREQILVAFGDLKKFEIARDNAKLRAQKKREHLDMMALDEIAIQQYSRKCEEDELD